MSFLAGLLGITLKQVGEQVGLSIIGASSAKLFNLILDGGKKPKPDPELKKELDQIRDQLNVLQKGILDIGKQIADLKLSVKTDLVQQYVNSINALYFDYSKALAKLAERAYEEPSPTKKKEFEAARARVIGLGHKISAEVYQNVENIHAFIAGQGAESLLAQVNAKAMNECDFLAYYYRVRSQLLNYWAIQVKAMTLLHLVDIDSEVQFVEGSDLIEDIKQKIQAQENFFNELVPASVTQLATVFMKEKSDPPKLGITFQSQGDRYIWGSTAGDQQACRIDMNKKVWIIETIQPLTDIHLLQDYYFRLSIDGAYLVLVQVDDNVNKWGATTYTATGPVHADDQSWKIRPTPKGQFMLEFNSKNELNHWYLDTAKLDEVPALSQFDKVDPGHPGQLFTIGLA